jgi:hypothetical protein
MNDWIPSLLLWRKEKREEGERKRAEERKSVIILP